MIDRVYIITGEDAADDSAYGNEPVQAGAPEEIASWLRTRSDLDQLSVWREDGEVLWARDYLADG